MGTTTKKAKIIEFLEREYVVPDAAKLIDFSEWEWQEKILTDVMENTDESGEREYNTVVVSTPRQQGKSVILQCLGSYFLFGGGRDLSIASFACDKEQASLVPERAKKAIKMNSRLNSIVTIRRNEITCPANGNKWLIMSSDQASSVGGTWDVILWDELGMLPEHQWNLVYLMLPSQSAVKQPLMVIASTVGEAEEGPLDDFMKLGREEGSKTYLFESNELLSPLINADIIERDRKMMPPAVFARHYQNLIIRGAAFLTDEQIEGIIRPIPKSGRPPITHGDYIGNDWGLTKDKCAVVRLGKESASTFQWTASRVFRGTKEDPVDLNEAEEAVRELYQKKRTRRVVFDKWQAVQAIQTLQGEWGSSTVEGYDITKPFRRKLFKCLFGVVREQNLVIYSDILQTCWKQSCGTCKHNISCNEKNAHDFLRELQGLQCDSNFDVTHGKRGDDIVFAVSEALFAGSEGKQAGQAKQYTGRY